MGIRESSNYISIQQVPSLAGQYEATAVSKVLNTASESWILLENNIVRMVNCKIVMSSRGSTLGEVFASIQQV